MPPSCKSAFLGLQYGLIGQAVRSDPDILSISNPCLGQYVCHSYPDDSAYQMRQSLRKDAVLKRGR